MRAYLEIAAANAALLAGFAILPPAPQMVLAMLFVESAAAGAWLTAEFSRGAAHATHGALQFLPAWLSGVVFATGYYVVLVIFGLLGGRVAGVESPSYSAGDLALLAGSGVLFIWVHGAPALRRLRADAPLPMLELNVRAAHYALIAVPLAALFLHLAAERFWAPWAIVAGKTVLEAMGAAILASIRASASAA